MNYPLISVVVIAYNSSRYIIETLNSIKNQTYENIELIISDDASTDNTVVVCRNWLTENVQRFKSVQLVTSTVNTGTAGNCNRGFQAAQGKWIKATAGDDLLTDDCVEEFVKYIAVHPDARVVFSKQTVFRDHLTAENVVGSVPDYPNHFFNQNITAREQYHKLLINDQVGNSSTLFFFKEAMQNVGWYEEQYYPDDYQMWLKMTREGYKLHFLDKPTTFYRSHADAVFNYRSNQIVRHHSIRLEPLKRALCYPHLTWIYRLKFRHLFIVNHWFYHSRINRITPFNKFAYSFLIKYANPVWYLINTLKIIGLKPNHVKKSVRR